MLHNLCMYDVDDELAGPVAAFLEQGLDAGEATVTVLPPRKWALLQEVLGPAAAARISYVDRDSFYTRPEAALAGYDATVRRYLQAGMPAVRVFGELPLCTTQEESDTWIMYEAILNRAFAHYPGWILCGCDVREQPQSVLDGSTHTHPRLFGAGFRDNAHYHDPAEIVRAVTPEPQPLTGLRTLPLDGTVRTFRVRLAAEMTADGVSGADVRDMLAAAGEVLENAHRHGAGARAVRLGRVGDRFVLELSDHGPGIDDPLVGYLPPHPASGGAAGMWVARQLTKRLELIPSWRGLTTRLWV
jgi:anti-sigma regulatory factor (Ser/Thr protein kinase)